MKYLITALVLMMISFDTAANEIEEVIVVGSKSYVGVADPSSDNILATIEPTRSFALGAFNGLQLSGTDTKHNLVYKNGVPVNDPSSGWYDFGHDLTTNQKVTVITGANSVRFGSSSMAGVVLIEDNFGRGLYTTVAEDKTKVVVEHEYVQVAYYKGTYGSVKTDNEEVDWYENKTFKVSYGIEDVDFNLEFIDYSYDYDTCYDSNFAVTNDCNVQGEKVNVAINHDIFTLGYTTNEADHNTGYSMKSDRTYGDVRLINKGNHELGVTGQRETYDKRERDSYSAYYIWSTDNVSIGYRYEEQEHIARIGLEKGGYRFSLGNSYRLPNLYEQFGDSWVSANPNLLPEQGVGTEFGYNEFSVYYYSFDEGIDFDMSSYGYVNTGSYTSKGIRWEQYFGNYFLYSEYTDSDKLRVPTYRTKVAYSDNGFTIEYVGEFQKGYDFDGRKIDDVSTFNISYSLNNFKIEIEDLLDNPYESVPDYAAGGRTFRLSWNLLW